MKSFINFILILLLTGCLVGISSSQSIVKKGNSSKANAIALQKNKQVVATPGKVIKVESPPPPTVKAHFLGEIRIFAGTFAPKGWQYCEGQILEINGNVRLFSLLGTIYGGDGRQTFGLPDLRQAEIPFRTRPDRPNSGPRYIISINAEFPERP